MKVEKNKIVAFSYKLFLYPATLIEEIVDSNPQFMIHGTGPWPQAFFDNLNGLSPGDEIEFVLTPEQGFGVHDPEKITDVPRENLDKAESLELEVGTTLPMIDGNTGHPMFGTIVELDDKIAKVDFNHPLAGNKLVFKGKIISVRNARPIELDTGKIDGVNYRDVDMKMGEA